MNYEVRLFPHVEDRVDELPLDRRLLVRNRIADLTADPHGRYIPVDEPVPCHATPIQVTEPGRIWVFTLFWRFDASETSIVVFDFTEAHVPML